MAGDPFLSDPSRKRKRASKTSRPSKASKTKNASRSRDDGEISSETDSDGDQGNVNLETGDGLYDEENVSSDEEFEQENEADKRRRLAKQYLDNLKDDELSGQFNDFDAADLDDDILSKRLQEDVAENKGFVYKFVGEKLASQIHDISLKVTRIGCKNLTDLTIRYPFLYTVSKDMELIKWDISTPKPQRIKHIKGGAKYFTLNEKNVQLNNHWDQINCIAASPDGKYVVTGGNDSRLIIWSSENLSCLKVFLTRAAVNSITFRRNTDQLYAACADLRIRTYSINQFSQLEILYGHQDNITDISSLGRETCVSVGSRDKTAMFWKISEESRLTFRGGDSTEKKHKRPKKKKTDDENDDESKPELPFHSEGSIDVVSMVDESHFVTGSDNGNIALWSLAKKKALFTERLAHDLQPSHTPSQASAETSVEKASQQIPERQPYWITAIHSVPYSDIFVTGSYNGTIKIWKIDQEGLRSFRLLGEITNIKGVVVAIKDVEIQDNKKIIIYALISKEHKFGRWLGKIPGSRNALVSFSFDI